MSRFKTILKAVSPFLIPLALLVLAWFNPLYPEAEKILVQSDARALESIAIMEELHLIAQASASVHIPIVSGRFQGAAESIRTATKFLSIAAIAGVLNTMLLKLSHFKFFLWLLIGLFLLAFIKKYRAISLKLIWLALMVNPGLSLFSYGIHWVDEKLMLTDKDSLHQEITLIHKDFTKKEEARKKKIAARKSRQLERDRKRGRDKLTFLQRTTDDIGSDISGAALHLEEDFDITAKTIRFATKKIKTMVLNFFTSVLLLSLILPLGYLYLCYMALKHFFPSEARLALRSADESLGKEGIHIPQVAHSQSSLQARPSDKSEIGKKVISLFKKLTSGIRNRGKEQGHSGT